MSKNKIYTASWYGNLAPGAGRVAPFWVLNNYKSLSISSIFFDYQLFQMPGMIPVPLEINTAIRTVLNVFTGVMGEYPASPFHFNPGGIDNTGQIFGIYTPGQLRFEDFFCNNRIDFELNINNTDLLITYFYNASVVVEIKEF